MADRSRWQLALALAACAALGASAERPLSGACPPRLAEEPMAFIQTQVEVEHSSLEGAGHRFASMLQEAAEARMDSGWAGEGSSPSAEALLQEEAKQAREVPKQFSNAVSNIESLDKDFWLMLIIIVESTVLLFTIGIPSIIWLLAYVLGRIIKGAIETFDRLVIGTDVTMKDLRTNVFNGVVSIEGLEVHNPTTGTCKHCKDVYNSKYLLKAGIVHIDVDMAALFCSFFSHFKVEKIEFKNVDVIVEKGRNSSNVQDVMNFLAGNKGTPAVEDSDKAKAKEKTASAAKVADEPAKASRTQITLHEVSVEDVGARLEAQMLGGRGMRVSVGDIRYDDFAEEVGESTVGPIVQVLLKSVLKTVAVNTLGKKIGEYLL
jgi:hypothetical protein